MVRKDYINKLKNGSITLNIPKVKNQTYAGNGKYSLGIVNSEGNGKRVSFSKALTAKLELTDTVYIVPLPDEGVLLISKEKLHSDATYGKLSGNDKKYCYSAGMVALLIESFKLDFEGHTSKAFGNIEIDDSDDIVYAVVTLSKPLSESGDAA